jgi:cytosine permease
MNDPDTKEIPLKDTGQSWWQLSVIQLAGWISLPTLATSILLLQKNSFLGAILTIIVGNAILWFIRLGIVSMSHNKRQSTLDVSRDYLGNLGSYFIAVLLLLSTLIWFLVQTSVASSTITHLVDFQENTIINRSVQVSVLLGLVSTFLCMEGIILLRRLSTIAFPLIVLCYCLIFFSMSSEAPLKNDHPLSLNGLTLILATNLGVSSDLPTFFRHSKSWNDSVKALIVIQLVSIGLAIASLYFGSLILKGFAINEHFVLSFDSKSLYYGLIGFIFFSVIVANVANVYSASVGWEAIAPKSLVGRKEYLILGLGLTIIYILFSNLFSLDFLMDLSEIALVFLCIILIGGYLISKWLGPPKKTLQITYFISWILAILSFLFHHKAPSLSPLLLGTIVMIVIIGIVLSLLSFFRIIRKNRISK